mmetsp:Transcript_20929/g.30970  ORF Transcript_20929/g.30970 Transcript_20929/m.30970 type:complete len:98 (+) Transcript_20929:861-1154(+)
MVLLRTTLIVGLELQALMILARLQKQQGGNILKGDYFINQNREKYIKMTLAMVSMWLLLFLNFSKMTIEVGNCIFSTPGLLFVQWHVKAAMATSVNP